MAYTQHRLVPWREVMGADGEKIFAFGDILRERQFATVTASPTIFMGAVVPSGKIWVITAIFAVDLISAMTGPLNFTIYDGVTSYEVNRVNAPAAQVAISQVTNIMMIPGDRVRVVFNGVTVGDTVIMAYQGYKMTIP